MLADRNVSVPASEIRKIFNMIIGRTDVFDQFQITFKQAEGLIIFEKEPFGKGHKP